MHLPNPILLALFSASAISAHLLDIFPRHAEDEAICSIYTVVESPVVISTCFESNTVLVVEGCSTSLEVTGAPTCVVTTVTRSETIGSSGWAGSTAPAETGTEIAPMTRSESASMTPPTTGTPTGTGTETATTSPTVPIIPPPSSSTSPTTTPPPPASSSTPSSTPSSVSTSPTSTPTPHISLDGLCGPLTGATCQDSTYGNCCSGTGFCGHAAVFCGDGCQGGWGYCTNVSNDGTCGFGVTCLGSQFGDCCSQYMICGSDGPYCGAGCNPEFGKCSPP